MNSPEVGEVNDGDVGCACHLRGSLRKSVYVTDMETGEILESVCVNNEDMEVGHKSMFAIEVFDNTKEGDDCYVVDEFEGDQLRESDGVDSRENSVVDNVDVVEAQVGAKDQPMEQM
ncbi:Hypothetical predicted protein [Olea europaea subsp. europaea]|uniref:Uncharacterized protein n=1 Tax=Olea europaea subsp. europaea TaxID=158383 RepID=A0A8S0RQM8_OLEEU|nr:Hypothetical predicted protein [Olea europaea subsp. europaea]